MDWPHPAVDVTAVVALVIAYSCWRFQAIGHDFTLVTWATREVVRLLLIAGLNEIIAQAGPQTCQL